MKNNLCPTCQTEIAKWWENPVRKGTVIGHCPTCRKMVNLGRADGTESGSPASAGAGKEAGKKESKKTQAGRGKNKTAPASGGKCTQGQSSQPGLRIHEVMPSQADSGQHSATSSTEPRPGQPLTQEAEQILHEVPASIGGAGAGEALPPIGQVADAESIAAAAMLSELASAITFEEQDVRELLEMGFGWMAEKFESEHWNLTERQSRMMGRPAAQLRDFAVGEGLPVPSRVADARC